MYRKTRTFLTEQIFVVLLRKRYFLLGVTKKLNKRVGGHALPTRDRDRLIVYVFVMMASLRGRGEKIKDIDL